MAEYINKKDLKFLEIPIAPVLQGEQVHYEQGFLKEWLESIPTTDVIEREKIDKAIAEIKELYTEWENSSDDARLESNPFGAVLNIIQRNIGE